MVGKGMDLAGGSKYVDDVIAFCVQRVTQYDALGHVWYHHQLWNGMTLKRQSVAWLRLVQRRSLKGGISGHGVFLDMARLRRKDALDEGEKLSHEDLLACTKEQEVVIDMVSMLLISPGDA